jgi:hypothetical protein
VAVLRGSVRRVLESDQNCEQMPTRELMPESQTVLARAVPTVLFEWSPECPVFVVVINVGFEAVLR